MLRCLAKKVKINRGKERGSPKSVGFILWGPRISVPRALAIYPLVGKAFY